MSRRLPPLVAAALALVALCALPAAASAKRNPWLHTGFLNMAHQGGEDEFPSATMFAFREALRGGANTLELDTSPTKDGVLVVMHDTSVDRTTNGSGWLNDMTWRQVSRLDAAYNFVRGRNAVKGLPAKRYRYRGIATGKRKPPKGYSARDFRVPRLDRVLRAFPHTPINIEIKGRGDDPAQFLHNSEVLAKLLRKPQFRHRRDLIVVSFNQDAVNRFHELVPQIAVAPGVSGIADFLLGGKSPGPGTAALQIPITYELGGQLVQVTTPDTVYQSHRAGYAVHVWLSDDTENVKTYDRLLDECVDGIMPAKPLLLARVLRKRRVVGPDGRGYDPCSWRATSARRAGRTAILRLRKLGLEPGPQRGSVELRAGSRHGRLLGRGRFAVPAGVKQAELHVRLRRASARKVLALVRTSGARGEPRVTRVKLG